MVRSQVPAALLLLVTLGSARAGCVAPYWQQTVLNERGAMSIALADFDGDGRPDVAGMTANNVFVMRNTGGGTFAPPVDVLDATGRLTLLAGDFTGDGRADLVFAKDAALVVLPGKGDGTFGLPVETPIDVKPDLLAAARFDSDASLDLAVVDIVAAKMVIYRNSAGHFSELQTVAVQSQPSAVTAADLDGDGRADVIVGYDVRSTFDVFYGRAGGTLDSPATILGTAFITAVRAADMDGDGLADVAFIGTYGTIGVVRNLGSRRFGDPLRYTVAHPLYSSGALLALDLTGDNKPDLVTSCGCGIRTSTGSGTGTLTMQWLADQKLCYSSYWTSGGVVAGDFDGDGRIDLVAALPRQGNNPAMVAFRNLCGDDTVNVANVPQMLSVGQSITMNVFITPTVEQDQWLIPGGSVTLRDGEQALGTKTLSTGGTTFTVGDLALGAHTFVADYGGDQQYEARHSTPVTVTVTTATTSTTLTADPPAGLYGFAPQLTATVSASSGDAPTGTIRFLIDGQTTPSQSDGKAPKATLRTSLFAVGEHTFVAQFLGDATHPPSSATLRYVIARQPPKMVGSPSFATATTAGKDFAVGVLPSGDVQQPTGTLTLRVGGAVVGTATLGYNYQHFTLPALTPDRYWFRVGYSGDANFAPIDTMVRFVLFPANPPQTEARAEDKTVTVTWNGADHIYVSRKKGMGAWSGSCCLPPPFTETIEPETVYVYRSESYDHTSISFADVAMSFPFTDDPLLPEQAVTGAHLLEVVRAANILRTTAGLAPFTLPPPPHGKPHAVGGGPITTPSAVTLLRAAINQARDALGAYRYEFSAPFTASGSVTAAQVQELREAVR